MNQNIEIGKRIKLKREECGLTQEELGKAVDLNKSTIQRYETGKIEKIKLPVIQAIAQVLKVDPNWLILKCDDPSAPRSSINKEKPAMTSRQKKICELFVDLTTEQQDNIIGRAELMVEQNEEEYKKEDCG